MEIKKLSDNQIRCALTEEEIQEMGFDIDEIIGNTEITQKFMRDVLMLIEEHANISMENISPMVKAELLQDHSMAITFGGDSDNNFKSLVDTVNHLMSQMLPGKLQEFQGMSKEEKQSAIDGFLEDYSNGKMETGKDNKKIKADKDVLSKVTETSEDAENEKMEVFIETMPFGLEFPSLDDAIRLSHLFFGKEKVPKSSLYRLKNQYFLLMDFIGFTKEELRPLAFAAVEYDKSHFSEPIQVAYIKEHGKCLVENGALQTLMQL